MGFTINRNEYHDKVLGCWMGKNIGGTLGAPMEWRRQINKVSFYTQELKGEPLPNDDLDIQLIWLIALEERGPEIDAKLLGEYWLLYVTPHWAEYGTAKANLRSGLMPPSSGTFNNVFKDSCGAFIRSEIWACVTPGCPRMAARYAYEDGILDHGNGEGTYAAVFCATLESAAFVESDIAKLIEIGLSYIPAECGVARAVRAARKCHDDGKTWQEARDEILRHYRGSTFMGFTDWTSPEDQKKGFADGQLGWDAPSNIGMVIIALLYGAGDFEKTVCTAVNCGEDTDCTAATVGSIFGIMKGLKALPQKWIEPIGRKIKTLCVNLGDMGGQVPGDIDNLSDRTERVARRVIPQRRLPVEITDGATDLSKLDRQTLSAGDLARTLYTNVNATVHKFDFFDVAVDCGPEPTIASGVPKTVRLRFTHTYKIQTNLNVRWLAPESWKILPSRGGQFFIRPGRDERTREVAFTIETPAIESGEVRLAVEITRDGFPSVMLVPVVLINGNLKAPTV